MNSADEIQQLRKQVAELNEYIEVDCTQAIQNYQVINSELERRLAECEKEINYWKDLANRPVTDNTQLIANMESELTELKLLIKSADAYTGNLEQDMASRDNTIATLEHCIENRAKQWAEQHIKIAEQAERIKELEAIISQQNARLSQCEKLAQSVMLDIGDRNEH